jgi:integrase
MPVYYRKLSKGIRFYYSFTFNSKVCFSKCIYVSKKEAQQAERERFNQLDEERRFGKQDRPLRLRQMIDERLNFLSVKYSHSHKICSDYYLNRFFDYMGDVDIRDISRKDVEDFLLDYSKKLRKQKVDNYPINSSLKMIKSMINYVIESYDLVIKNPCQNIKPYSVNKKLKFIPSDAEIDKLLSLVNDRQKLLVHFVMETGCRINEAYHLDFEDIKEDYLVFYTSKSKNSDRMPRKVPIPDCIKGLKGKGRVFSEWTNTPKFLDRTLRANNLKIWGWHSLRHRYASLLSKQNKPIFELMSLLGHSNISTTQKYLQLLS